MINSWNHIKWTYFWFLKPQCGGASRACSSPLYQAVGIALLVLPCTYTPRFVPVLVSVVFTYTMVQVIQKWLEVAYFDRWMFIQLISVVIFLFFANSLECWLLSIKGQKISKRNYSCLQSFPKNELIYFTYFCPMALKLSNKGRNKFFWDFLIFKFVGGNLYFWHCIFVFILPIILMRSKVANIRFLSGTIISYCQHVLVLLS